VATLPAGGNCTSVKGGLMVSPQRILTFILLMAAATACSAAPPQESSMLPQCPDRPNCVSSLQQGTSHAVPPMALHGTTEAAMETAEQILRQMGAASVSKTENGIHAVFRSRIFGFKDDMHIVADSSQGLLHIRSASRTGYYDFGVNRRRALDFAARYADATRRP